ncbi:MAG: hypothetical protein H7062_02865, partial [Candidatus Saccharimonas sp.]|nr:hypothetical protein [Planctomycetaceae bacterium]
MLQTVRRLCKTLFITDSRGVRRNRRFARAVEAAEVRLLLSSHALTVVADGTVADRDLDGQSDVALTSDTNITNRWFNLSGIGQERGVFEFDLSQFTPGSTVLSAKIGLYVTSFTSGVTNGPQLVFRVSAGDGAVTLSDGDVAGVAAGTGTVGTTGYKEFNLSAAALQSLAGGMASVRMQNSALDGHWVSVASSEDTLHTAPTLILEIGPPTLNLSITPDTISEDGTQSATGTLSRTGDISQALTVSLSTSDTSETSLPSTVTFAAGASSVEFSITAVDDALIDGSQAVTISASAQTLGGPAFGADTTFGTNGIATTRLATNIQGPNAAMAVQADGKILAASEAGSGSWRITRHNANGSSDTSFGTDGMTTTTLGSNFPVPYRIVVQANGKILVGGKYAGGIGSAVLTRYNANGTIDTSFGNSGIADLGNAGGWIEDIAVRPDGRILLAIAFNGTSWFRVAGLTSSGQFDSNFGIKTYTSINELARSIELLDDGKFILAGGNAVARFTATGALDTTYGTNGVTRIELPSPKITDVFDAKLDALGRLSLGIYVWQMVG